MGKIITTWQRRNWQKNSNSVNKTLNSINNKKFIKNIKISAFDRKDMKRTHKCGDGFLGSIIKSHNIKFCGFCGAEGL